MGIHALIRVAPFTASLIGLPLLPLARAVLEPACKLACIAAAVSPFVLTEAVGLAIRILPDIAIAISEEI